jgi:hypothetical protein
VNPLKRKITDKGFVKLAKAAPFLMPFFLRGAAEGASRMGNRRMIEQYGRRLADMGIDPYDLPGKKQTTWIDPTMIYGMGLGLGAHTLNSYFGSNTDSDAPLFLGTALGGALGAKKTYDKQLQIAKDLIAGKKTEDTDYVKTKDYIRDTLEAQKKK